ncbi:MAG: hypothetical protein IT328_23690 [Caldilineaceae bacterium]|nr:hypothetical protein [Caldilineaceae bacterium]
MVPWLFVSLIVYVVLWRYVREYRHNHWTRSEWIMGGAGFLLMFVAWALYSRGITWPRILASTWIGLSSGLGFGATSRFVDRYIRRAR